MNAILKAKFHFIKHQQSMSHNPYEIVGEFEERVAEWTGAPHAVAVESGSMAILLSLLFWKENYATQSIKEILIPTHTYPSVPCSIIFAGFKVRFYTDSWSGEYPLRPFHIWDSALRFKKNMYRKDNGTMQCLSFHIKKHLPIGRGGMILCSEPYERDWLRKARFDGRSAIPLSEDNFVQLGLNAYMEPANAARGIQLFEVYRQKYPDGAEDLKVEEQGYPDLSKFPIYQQ